MGLAGTGKCQIMKEMRNTVPTARSTARRPTLTKPSLPRSGRWRISLIYRDNIGFDKLPDGLKDVALTSDISGCNVEGAFGGLLENPIGKSGVNHRLRKLSGNSRKVKGTVRREQFVMIKKPVTIKKNMAMEDRPVAHLVQEASQ